MLTFLTTKYYQKISLNCNNITSFQRKALHTLQVYSFHTLCKMRWTYLIVPTRFIFIKRSMQITKYVVKNHLMPKSRSVLNTTMPPSREYASAHGGRLKKNAGPLMTSKSTQPESDLTGAHELAFMAVCNKKGCKDQNCATGTQLGTQTTQANPCGESTQYHQQPVGPHPVISIELAGNSTSNIPSNKDGIIIDLHEKRNGSVGSQELVTEKDKVPVPVGAIKENPQSTAYYQKDDRTKALIDAMPADSTLNQK